MLTSPLAHSLGFPRDASFRRRATATLTGTSRGGAALALSSVQDKLACADGRLSDWGLS